MLLKATFKPLSPFRHLPESFTVFGAICWGVKVLYGDGELENMLDMFSDTPPFLISSPLVEKEGSLLFPKPILKDGWGDITSMEEYEEKKKAKGLKLVDEEAMRKVLEGEISTDRELWEEVKPRGDEDKAHESVSVPHASINRITWTTAGGQLYNEEAYYWSGRFAVLLYFRDTSYVDMVKASLRFTHLGGNRTTGMGYCEVEFYGCDDSWIRDYMEETTGEFISLSPTFYDSSYSLEESYYDVFPLLSPVDNYYAVVSPAIWKRRTVLISKGSLIRVKDKRDFYGQVKVLLENTESGKKIYHYGLAFPLFVRCRDEA